MTSPQHTEKRARAQKTHNITRMLVSSKPGPCLCDLNPNYSGSSTELHQQCIVPRIMDGRHLAQTIQGFVQGMFHRMRRPEVLCLLLKVRIMKPSPKNPNTCIKCPLRVEWLSGLCVNSLTWDRAIGCGERSRMSTFKKKGVPFMSPTILPDVFVQNTVADQIAPSLKH